MWVERLGETAPLISAPAFFGPPVLTLLGPWLLLVLVLIGPFALILTFLFALTVAAGLLGVLLGLIATPYLLVRHVRASTTVSARRRQRVWLPRNHRARSGRLGTPQTKGLS